MGELASAGVGLGVGVGELASAGVGESGGAGVGTHPSCKKALGLGSTSCVK